METRTHRGTRALAQLGVLSLALLALTFGGSPARADVTIDNVSTSIASAKTAADHEAIAKYFEGQAAEARKSAEAHKAMLKSYERFGTGKEQAKHATHCKDAIRSYENLAKDYDALAKDHMEMAKGAK
jgi:hypothetical protein